MALTPAERHAEQIAASVDQRVARLGNRGSARLEGRNGQIWRRYTIYRQTQEQIAEDLGLTIGRVSQIITEIRKTMPPTDIEEMRQQSMALYAELTERAMEIADMAAAPVAVGKDGQVLYDPETGEVVRDYSGRLRAMETAMKMDQETRKLMGLDAAIKAEVTAAVRYEIVGVDTQDLS